MTDGRKRTARVLATLCITALGGSMLVAAPTYAEPDIDSVQSRVDTLYQQAEQASERYNNARLELKQAADAAHRAAAPTCAASRPRSTSMREQVATAVVAQYQGQALSSTTQVVLSDDPDAFLDQLTTVSAVQRPAQPDDGRLRRPGEAARDAPGRRQARARPDRRRPRRARHREGRDRREGRRGQGAARHASRTAPPQRASRVRAQRPRRRQPVGRRRPPAPPASGRAGAPRCSYAMAQVGDAYVYGAAGPSAFDCSGLTMMAWGQAGVGLPHSSSAQMGSGTPVVAVRSCSPATWCSTTARSATSACTSATARS